MKTSKHVPLLILGWFVLSLVTGSWLLRQRTHRPESPAAITASPPTETPDPFAEFSTWLKSHARENPAQPATAAGLELARERRVVMETLMRTNPRRALREAVTLDVWKHLPPEIQAEVEEPFSATANYRVLPVCITGSPDAARVKAGEMFPDATRLTEIDGQPPLDSYVFGRRQGLASKAQSPVQGIRLGNEAALREEVFQQLLPGEIKIAESIYPLANPAADRDFATGKPLGGHPLTALAGGRIFKFAGQAEFEAFEASIAALDEKPGPHGGAALLFLPSPGDGAAGFDLAGAITRNNMMASAWTETKKKVFMIRCDFSDKPNGTFPVVDSGTYGALLNTTVSDTLRDCSYGKTWIEATVSADVIRLPQPATYYDDEIGGGSTRNTQLLTDAKAAYKAAHPSFAASDYDIVGVWFVSIGMKGSGLIYAGLAGGSDLWIQGTTDAGVHVHELGHNYGLGHSSFWTPPGGSTNPADPAGGSVEYGDVFDIMGDGPVPEGVFHPEAKQRLNWLESGAWTAATTSGTYRIHRIDHPNTTGVRGLRLTRGTDDYFWLSYRRLFENPSLKAGANVVWKRPEQSRSWLLDTTPGTLAGAGDRTDGSIAIGRTFTDGNTHLTPLARGGSTPNEYLDIQVNIGPFPGNVAPTVALNGPSSIRARQTCIFTAQAVDANGDKLAYSWDFGQGFTFDNHPSVAHAWESGGTYTVKVTVSDMKGNRVQVTKSVTVADPILTWTVRPNSSAGDFKALVASPDKVIAVGEDYASFNGPVAISGDGVTWTATQLGNNQQAFAGVWDGTRFLLAGQDYDFTAPAGWRGCVFTSPTANAGTWTRRIFSGPALNGIAYGGGVYVAVGPDGTIRRSIDGINWPTVNSGTSAALTGVAYGGGRFVAVGRASPTTSGNAVVLTSNDGNSWTNTTAGAGILAWQDLRHVHRAGDRFLASGFYGKIRQSTDLGATFTPTRETSEETPGIAYGNGVWFAAGTDYGNSSADIDLVSTDGSSWNVLPTPDLDDRNAAIFFKNTFITAGDNHSIRQSGAIPESALGYLTWRESNFPDHGPLSSPDSDNDADGMSNLLEYSLGRSAVSGTGSNGPAALPQAVLISNEPLLDDRISLQVSMPDPAAADLVYVVEATSNLNGTWAPLATKVGTGGWVWNSGGTSRIVTGTPVGGRVLVKIGDAVPISGNPRRFLRLRSSVNP